MKGHSAKEMEVISDLTFQKKQYFRKADIEKHFKDVQAIRDFIFGMKKKGRIIKLNRDKYFLVPIKARHGRWSDNPITVADEMMDGKNYFIGGWYAAMYWQLTDQVPMQVDIYTTRRQGKTRVLNKRFVFHRTTKKRAEKAENLKVEGHGFRIMSKEDTARWMKSRK